MKKLIPVTLVLLLFLSCNSTDKEDNNETKDMFVNIESAALESFKPDEKTETGITQEEIDKLWSRSFSGLMDNEYKIFMQLYYVNENKIEGYYFYESSGKNMFLKGKRTNSGFFLEEFNSKDKHTGSFEGDYKSGVFSGKWIKADGSKELSFNMEDIDFTSNCNTVKISELVMDVPGDNYEEVKFPVYECDNKALEKRLNFYYSESLTGTSVEELEEQAKNYEETGIPDGFSGFYYSIDYNENCILTLDCSVESVGAHMYYDRNTYNIDLRSGLDLKIGNMIKTDKIKDLVKYCNQVLQKSINFAIEKHDPEGEVGIAEMLSESEFTVNQLNNFSISERGLSFEYFFDFPHVLKAAEPNSYITIPFSKLKEYVNPKGPLHFVLN